MSILLLCFPSGTFPRTSLGSAQDLRGSSGSWRSTPLRRRYPDRTIQSNQGLIRTTEQSAFLQNACFEITHHASFNVPLIIAGDPITAKGQVENGLTSQLDLHATLLALASISSQATVPSAANDLSPVLDGKPQTYPDAVFMEQEETRAIRTDRWLYMQRFNGAADFPTTDALFELHTDPVEKNNLAADPEHARTIKTLRAQITNFFETHSQPKYDLWSGGSAKSNTQAPELWQNAWGPDWTPETPSR